MFLPCLFAGLFYLNDIRLKRLKMQNRTKNILALTIALICFSGFVALMVMVTTGYDFNIDKLNTLLYNNQNQAVISFFKVSTYFGSWWVMLIFSLLILIFCKDKKVGAICLITLAIAIMLNLSVKYIVCRARPENMLIKEIGYSFPSAHAMLSFAFYGLLIYWITKKFKSKATKVLCSLVLACLIGTVGFSRIILNVHYVSDVLAGFLFGFVALYISLLLGRLLKSKPAKQLVNPE